MVDDVWEALEKEAGSNYDEIKKMFFKYDCSLFAIAREQKEVYENYKKLNISKATLEEWKQELFLALWKQLKQNGSSDLFNRMCGLSENRHNRENLLTQTSHSKNGRAS